MTKEENTYAFDTESAVEMARLINQGQILTEAMEGPLGGVFNLPANAQILDLGCGPGGWVLDVAYERPDASVAGVDISRLMIDYANARARSQQLSNASFGVMDVRQTLDFSDASFDLVNARLLVAAIKRETWEPLLAECHRILKPGGMLRMTEPVDFGVSNNQTYQQVMSLLSEALWKSGYGFSVNGRDYGMTNTLPGLFRAAGYQQVHFQAHALEFSSNTRGWQGMYDNYQAGVSVAPPLYVRAGLASAEEIVALYRRLLAEMLLPDFRAMWHLVSVIGTKGLV